MIDHAGRMLRREERSEGRVGEGRRGKIFFLQAEDGIRGAQESRGLGEVDKRQP